MFREANKRAKREVAKAKDSAYKDLYDKLDSIEGQTIIYKLSKTRERRTRDLTDIAYIKDSNGTILTDDLPIEVIMVVAEMKPELLTYILQRIMADGIPDSWKKSKLIPIFEKKGDILEDNFYRE